MELSKKENGNKIILLAIMNKLPLNKLKKLERIVVKKKKK